MRKKLYFLLGIPASLLVAVLFLVAISRPREDQSQPSPGSEQNHGQDQSSGTIIASTTDGPPVGSVSRLPIPEPQPNQSRVVARVLTCEFVPAFSSAKLPPSLAQAPAYSISLQIEDVAAPQPGNAQEVYAQQGMTVPAFSSSAADMGDCGLLAGKTITTTLELRRTYDMQGVYWWASDMTVVR